MTSSSEDGREGSWAAVLLRVLGGLAVLAVAHGGAYLALVEAPTPDHITVDLTPKTDPAATVCDMPKKGDRELRLSVTAPPYRWGGNRARNFFALAFAIDHRLRPAHWELRLRPLGGPPSAAGEPK